MTYEEVLREMDCSKTVTKSLKLSIVLTIRHAAITDLARAGGNKMKCKDCCPHCGAKMDGGNNNA